MSLTRAVLVAALLALLIAILACADRDVELVPIPDATIRYDAMPDA